MPTPSEDLTAALTGMCETGFKMDTAWEAAHQLAQANEGTPAYDALHAFCHRIEGDTGNAAYWDRRAGTDFGGQGHTAEHALLTVFVQNDRGAN